MVVMQSKPSWPSVQHYAYLLPPVLLCEPRVYPPTLPTTHPPILLFYLPFHSNCSVQPPLSTLLYFARAVHFSTTGVFRRSVRFHTIQSYSILPNTGVHVQLWRYPSHPPYQFYMVHGTHGQMLNLVSASQGPASCSPLAVMQVKPLAKDMLCAVLWSSCEPRAATGHEGKKRGAFQLNAPLFANSPALL